jgi:hypothetical protein
MSSLAMTAPRCPACDRRLAGDGPRHSCPGCGRAFTVAVEGITPGDVYRAAPIVALTPARDPAPRGWGLRVNRDGGVLDIRIGGRGLLARRDLAALAVLLNVAWLGVILLIGALPGGQTVLYVTFALAFSLLWAATRPMRGENERLIVANGRLVRRRMRGQDEVLATDAIELDRIVAVVPRDDHIALELDGGDVRRLGSGLGVPERVRGWVARRIANLLPPPGA